MDPFRKGSSDSKAPDTTTSGAANSGNTDAPKKLSLRVLDGDHGPLTREEDLSRGPLLLNIGDGIGAVDHPAASSPTGVEHEGGNEDSSQPYAGPVFTPHMTMGSTPTLPSGSTLHSEGSTAGVSRSVSHTDGGSSTSFPHRAIVHTGEQMAGASSYNEVLGPFPWLFEFSWRDSVLLFHGESFHVSRAPETRSSKSSPNSRIVSTTPPLSHPSSRTYQHGNFPIHPPFQDADLAGVGGSTASLPTHEIHRSVISIDFGPNSSFAKLAWKQSLAALAQELYDDFIRSYAPNTSKKRGRPAVSGDADSEGCKPAGKRTKLVKLVEKTTNIPNSESEGSDGEDSDGKGQELTRPTQYQSSYSLACPFIKWDQAMFHECTQKLTQIRYVRKHLKAVHLPPPPYCRNCYKVGYTDNGPVHHCPRVDTQPPGLMTPERVLDIEKRADRTVPEEEQWRYIYRTIFPGTPCPNPYLHFTISEPHTVADYYFHAERAKKLMEQGWPGDLPVQVSGFFYEWFLPKFLSPFLPPGGESSVDLAKNLARSEAQPVHPVLGNQTVEDRISPQVTDTCRWQFSPDSLGSGVDVGGDTNTASELLEFLSSIGD